MKVACFGELLLRLAAPGTGLLLQQGRLDVHVGGAEANVAVSLACLGHSARMLGAVPDHALGQAAVDELRRRGVDTQALRRLPGRMGLYFLTPGASLRPPAIVYDRADTAFLRSLDTPADWHEALTGSDWLHLSGITCALGAVAAEATLQLAQHARRQSIALSFDCNYRPSLWAQWDGDAAALLGAIAAQSQLLFADDRALALLLRAESAETEASTRFAALARLAFERYPSLEYVATTSRVEHDVDRQTLGGMLASRSQVHHSRSHELHRIVDRIGSGDAFAAGLLHGLSMLPSPAAALEFAVAAAALKHSIEGDANLASTEDIDAVLADRGYGVRR